LKSYKLAAKFIISGITKYLEEARSAKKTNSLGIGA